MIMESTEEIVKELLRRYEILENNLKVYQKQNSELKSEHYKDEQLAAMRDEVERLKKENRRGFPITEQEDEYVKQWMKDHEKVCSGRHGCIGGKYDYIFTPTSIGTVAEIKCDCGASWTFRNL